MTPEEFDLYKLVAAKTLHGTSGWARRSLICRLIVDNPAAQGIAACTDCRGVGCAGGFEKECESCNGAGVVLEYRTRPNDDR